MFAPERVHAPVPAFTSAVVFAAELSTMAPASSPVPAVEPCSVRVLLPAPVAVRSLENRSRPVPDWSTVAPPVVLLRLSTRLVVSPAPV